MGYDIDSSQRVPRSDTNPNDYVHKLNGNGTKVGTSMVLKVMSGDTVHVRANSWYRLNGVTPDQPVSPLNDLLAALAGGISKYTVGKFTQTQLLGSGVLNPSITELLGQQNYSSTKPKAYVNWVLFDEQFKFVSNGSGFDQVGADDEFKTHFLSGLQVTKNGYLYIYVSNETPNVDVFFDNLQVTHVRGPLLEETHYYPFGLTMAGISSKAAGKLENRFKYNGNKLESGEFSDGSGLEMYDFNARTYNQQLGRFMQIDPMAGKYFSSSPYNYVDGNPIVRNDPNGEDWFRDEKTGDVKWQAITGKQGEQVSLKGSKNTWTNLGSEFLVFSGDKITYYSQSTNADGKLSLNSQGYDAVSGAPTDPGSYVDKNGYLAFEPSAVFDFDFSKERQQQANQGPTPEGLYSINKSTFKPGENEHGTQKWSEQSWFNKLKAQVGGGTWPGGTDSWGEYRWQLKPESGYTYGRNNMYLHGGTKWGSRGCIDCGNNINTVANAILTNKTGNDKVYLQVVYPNDMKMRVANGTTNNLQKQ